MPGDQKNQAPNPLSAEITSVEITSVETDFNTGAEFYPILLVSVGIAPLILLVHKLQR